MTSEDVVVWEKNALHLELDTLKCPPFRIPNGSESFESGCSAAW